MATFKLGGLVEQIATTATAGGTTTLVNSSRQIQIFTGSSGQTIQLPVATTMSVGQKFEIYNSSTAVLTLNYQDASLFATINPSTSLVIKLSTNGTANGVWVTLSSSAAAGSGSGKNYLTQYTASTSSGVANAGNGNFELGTTTGWSLGTVGTLTNGIPTGSPTFGSGASGNLSIAVVSSSQLAASFSLSYVSSAATTQGNMLASNAFFIDAEDQAKVLTWKFYYQGQTNPANANWSGTSSNSFGVAVYDVTNSSWLTSTANFAMTQSSGIGLASGTCQTNSNTTQLRFVMYNVNATSGAITLYVDDFSVGPQTAPIGAPMTDWQSYSPSFTGFGTPTSTGFAYRRVGDSLEVSGYFTTGTNTAVVVSVSLPTGLSVDSTKFAKNATTANPGMSIGKWVINTAQSEGHMLTNTGTSGTLVYFGGLGSSANMETPTTGNIFGNAAQMSIWFRVPITGWSSNVQMSSDTDTRVCTARVHTTTTGTTVPNNTLTGLNFQTTDYDTHGAISTVSSITRFTVPVAGYYQVSSSVNLGTSSGSASGAFKINFYKNGSVVSYVNNYQANVGTENLGGMAGDIISCIPGDFLEVRVLQTSGPSTTTSTDNSTFFVVQRLTGPSVIAATESVNAKYANTAGTSIPNTADNAVPFATKVFDSHNGWNGTDTYTVPVSGKYRVSGTVNFSSQAYSAGGHIVMSVYQNGSAQSYGSDNYNQSTTTSPFGNAISTTVSCVAGDTLQIRVLNNRSGGASTLATTSGYNHIEIERIGN